MLATKFFSSSHDENQEAHLSQNPTVYKTQQFLQEKDELRQILSPVTIYMNKTLLHTCATCVTIYGPQNTPYICLRL